MIHVKIQKQSPLIDAKSKEIKPLRMNQLDIHLWSQK